MGSPIQSSSALSSEASIPSFLRLSAGEGDLPARSAPRLATPERAQHFAETFYAWLRHVPETEPILHHVDAGAWARLRAGRLRPIENTPVGFRSRPRQFIGLAAVGAADF